MSDVFSVIMPSYDQDSFLPGAVASLLAQADSNWELIVVDDGSPATRGGRWAMCWTTLGCGSSSSTATVASAPP